MVWNFGNSKSGVKVNFCSYLLQSLASAHDQVAERVYDEQLMLSDALDGLDLDDSNSLQHSNGLQAVPVAVRVVGIRKVPGEPLGVTLRVDEATGSLKVTRILDGGIVDRQGLYYDMSFWVLNAFAFLKKTCCVLGSSTVTITLESAAMCGLL